MRFKSVTTVPSFYNIEVFADVIANDGRFKMSIFKYATIVLH